MGNVTAGSGKHGLSREPDNRDSAALRGVDRAVREGMKQDYLLLILALPLVDCVLWGKLLNFSQPQVPPSMSSCED